METLLKPSARKISGKKKTMTDITQQLSQFRKQINELFEIICKARKKKDPTGTNSPGRVFFRSVTPQIAQITRWRRLG